MLVQRLDELDRSPDQFPEQLSQLLHDEQWIAALKVAPEDELGKLIGYLDNVRSVPTPTTSHLSPIDPRWSRTLRISLQKVPSNITENLQHKNDSPTNL